VSLDIRVVATIENRQVRDLVEVVDNNTVRHMVGIYSLLYIHLYWVR
jgi:hypothetical protein